MARGARRADQPPGDLPRPQDPAGSGQPLRSAGLRGRGGDHRGRAREPDRRLPDGLRAGLAQARAGGQPQARAQGDAPAAPDPAAPQVRPAPPARVLPSDPAERALASGHDLSLGRRARLGLPDGRDRLLHPRDRRLAPRTQMPRQGEHRARRARRRRAAHHARDADAGHRRRAARRRSCLARAGFGAGWPRRSGRRPR